MAITTIDYSKIEDSISILKDNISKLSDLFEEQDIVFYAFERGIIWDGKVKDACVEKYNELNKKYSGIIENLNNYNKYLGDIVNAYKEFDAQLNSQIDANE